VIDARSFRMVELLGEADLAAHPLWADFRAEIDRALILAWGVERARLDREIERLDYCGRAPLFPVLEPGAAAALSNPTVALRIAARDGTRWLGYRVGRDALGVFAGGREHCINPRVPALARRELEKLAAATRAGMRAADLLPLRHERVEALRGLDLSELERVYGPLEGEFDPS